MIGIELLNIGPWCIESTDGSEKTREYRESIFSQGNGYMGVRGYRPDQLGMHKAWRSTFIAGFFEYIRPGITDMVNQPDFSSLNMMIGGKKCGEMEVTDFSQRLDMRNGLVTWKFNLKDDFGRITNVNLERFLSMADRHLAALRLSVRPMNYSGEIILQLNLNGDVENLPISDNQMESNTEMLRLWDTVEAESTKDGGVLQAETFFSKRKTAMAFKVISNKDDIDIEHVVETKSVGVLLKAVLDKGQLWQVDKLVSVSCSRDTDNPRKQAVDNLAIKCTSYEELMDNNISAWERIWMDADVEIEGNIRWQGAIRYNIFQLIQTAPYDDENVSIGARGLMHGRYKGCYFWDTEIFMMPFFVNVMPDTARNLLMYRYHTLDDAIVCARNFSSKGARYSWMASDTGFEQCETWDTGCCEIHITADVAYAIGKYYDYSGNINFLKKYGAEILLQTARYWTDRFSYCKDEDCYHLLFVKGPDEYCGVTTDDFYTVKMAVHNLELALKTAKFMRDNFPSIWETLKEKIKLEDAELIEWEDITKKTVQKYDANRKLWIQDSTFEYLEPLDINKYKIDNTPLYKKISFDRLQRYQVLKQPAVLMYMALFYNQFSKEDIESAWNYYEPKTLHDSTLSFGIHSLIAARLEKEKEAEDYFTRTLFLDLEDIMNNTGREGIHTASLGATWQALIYGFAGLDIKNNQLSCIPRLPKEIQSMKFTINYKGIKYRMHINHNIKNADLFVLNQFDTEFATIFVARKNG